MPRYQNQRYKKKGDKTMPRTKKDQTQDKRLDLIEKNVHSMKQGVQLKYNNELILNKFPSFAPGAPYLDNLYLMNGIAIGDSQVFRDGAQIRMSSLLWNYTVSLQGMPASAGGQTLRMIIFIDHNPAGSVPILSDDPLTNNDAFLDNPTIGTYPLITQFQQYEQIKRFTILKDKTYDFNPPYGLAASGTSTNAVGLNKTLRGYRKLGQITKYDGSGDTIVSITRNALYVLFLVTRTNVFAINGQSRLYFKNS